MNFFLLIIVLSFIAVVTIALIYLCVRGVEGDWKEPSKMRLKRKHRSKFPSGVGSHSGELDYCENDAGGFDIDIEEEKCCVDDGGGCDYGGGDDGAGCDDGGGDAGGGGDGVVCDCGGGDEGEGGGDNGGE